MGRVKTVRNCMGGTIKMKHKKITAGGFPQYNINTYTHTYIYMYTHVTITITGCGCELAHGKTAAKLS